MSEVPLTFNNGQTNTTSELVVVQDRGRKNEEQIEINLT